MDGVTWAIIIVFLALFAVRLWFPKSLVCFFTKKHQWSSWHSGLRKKEVYRFCLRCSIEQAITGPPPAEKCVKASSEFIVQKRSAAILAQVEAVTKTAKPDQDLNLLALEVDELLEDSRDLMRDCLSRNSTESLLSLRDRYEANERVVNTIDDVLTLRSIESFLKKHGKQHPGG